MKGILNCKFFKYEHIAAYVSTPAGFVFSVDTNKDKLTFQDQSIKQHTVVYDSGSASNSRGFKRQPHVKH